MSILKEKWNNKKFIFTAELFPPKGTDVSSLLRKAELLSKFIDAYNVTDNQRAIMRISSLASSAILKKRGFEPVYQLTCRDRNRLALQSDLLGASALGIENLLLLGGDHPRNGDYPDAKPVYDLDSIQLVQTATELNAGFEMNGKQIKGKTDFFIGAAANPGASPIEPQLLSFYKKIKAGADFFQTQVIFDIATYQNFLRKIEDVKPNICILPGILVIKSFKMAKLLSTLPGVYMPENVLKIFENSNDPLSAGMKLAAGLITQLFEFADGVHIMAIGIEDKIPELINMSGVKNG